MGSLWGYVGASGGDFWVSYMKLCCESFDFEKMSKCGVIRIAVLAFRRGLRGSKLELSWGMLEHLGGMLGHLRAMLTHLGPMLGHLGGYVGASWGCLEPSWSHVAAKLVPRGAKQQKYRKT